MRCTFIACAAVVLFGCQSAQQTTTGSQSDTVGASTRTTPTNTHKMHNAEFARHWALRLARELDFSRITDGRRGSSDWVVRDAQPGARDYPEVMQTFVGDRLIRETRIHELDWNTGFPAQEFEVDRH